MTERDSPSARQGFEGELEQLRLQVEVMALRVDDALGRMAEVLATGDQDLADAAVAADDDVDAMHVSLTEQAYELIRRQQPVAADLRFLVSVLRIVEELERIGDLSLRVVKRAPDHAMLAAHPPVLDILRDMAAVACEVYRTAADAWTAQDVALASGLADQSRLVDDHYSRLSADILGLDGPDAVPTAVAAVLIGRALERIADHTVIVGERLRYLLTGDPAHLAAEVR